MFWTLEPYPMAAVLCCPLARVNWRLNTSKADEALRIVLVPAGFMDEVNLSPFLPQAAKSRTPLSLASFLIDKRQRIAGILLVLSRRMRVSELVFLLTYFLPNPLKSNRYSPTWRGELALRS